MLRSLGSLFLSVLFFHLRRKATVSQRDLDFVYNTNFSTSKSNRVYAVSVYKTVFTIDYHHWFYPKVKRSVYKAVLEYQADGLVKQEFTGYYPGLYLGYEPDPMYGMTLVAETHFNRFFEVYPDHDALC